MTDQISSNSSLPAGYLHIGGSCALHVSTIRGFTTDLELFMVYLNVVANDPSLIINIPATQEIAFRCKTSELKVGELTREYGAILCSIAEFLDGGDWHSDQPQPLTAMARQ
ncbi:MAG: hypothetical protein ACI9KM_001690 [Rubritalea sp.]|jgi:hypothetical protein